MAFIISPRNYPALAAEQNQQSNPMLTALQQAGSQGPQQPQQGPQAPPQQQAAQAQPQASGIDPTSRNVLSDYGSGSSNGYQPYNGPKPNNYTRGSIMWGLTGGANAPTQEQYLLDRQQNLVDQLGKSRAKAFTELSTLYQQNGGNAQRAFLQFMQSPEGVDFITKDPNPTEAVKQFLAIATKPEMAPADQLARDKFNAEQQQIQQQNAARQTAFGGGGAVSGGAQPGIDIFTGQPQGGAPAAPSTAAPAQGQPGIATPVQPTNTAGGQAPEVNGDHFRSVAQKLMATGDKEGAQVALTFADQLDKNKSALSTSDLKEYQVVVQQAEAAGKTPPDLQTYLQTIKKAGSNSLSINTAEGADAAAQKGRVEVDVTGAKLAAEKAMAATNALPALNEAEKLVNTPGGYGGKLNVVLGRIATTFGLPVDKNQSDAEALQALTMQLVPIVRQPGQVSNYEQQTYSDAVPSLSQTPEGRAKIIAVMKRQVQRSQDIAKTYRDNIGKPDLYAELAKLDTPMFTADEMNQFKAAAKAVPSDAQDNGHFKGPVTITGDADYNALPSGTTFIGPDGKQRKKP